ncbi:hypothetical protein [Helicobacter pylori]|uniref:hypothetical protein n=1 Tax=Helicobacter pylori TaxID=210 RepID=UPI000EAFD5A9|nr:hypothetical protein [Helicobacter pylori]RKV18412.1 hypothetical protein DD747_00235 [Helicobacter pylori]
MRLKIYKSRVWICSHIGNKNTQRHFKINIKDLHQTPSDNFLKHFFRGFNGVKGGVISQKSLYPL